VLSTTLILLLLAACSGPTVVEQADHIGNYNISFSVDPQSMKPPQVGSVSYGISDATTGKPVSAFDTVYGALIHNVLMSRDLTLFSHNYTNRSQQNQFSMRAVFPESGKYYSHTLFQPAGADLQVLTGTVQIGDEGNEPELVVNTGRSQTAYGARFDLLLGSNPIRAGQPTQLGVYVTERGAPVTALWPFLGAPGYLWVIDSEGNDFGVETGASEAHSYPAEASTPQARPSPSEPPAPPPTFVPTLQAELATRTAQPVPTLFPVQLTPQQSVIQTPGAVVPSVGYGPTVAFTHTFPKPGYYKIWSEVQYRDQVIAVGWMLKVEP